MLELIVTGGQTGVDQLALSVAHELNIPTFGYVPKNFMTMTGPNYELGTKYGLIELPYQNAPLAAQYIKRTKKNVDITQATLVFSLRTSAGTDKTIGYCLTGKWVSLDTCVKNKNYKQHRPCFVVIDVLDEERLFGDTVNELVQFLQENNVKKLNIAGHRSISDVEHKQIENFLKKSLELYSTTTAI